MKIRHNFVSNSSSTSFIMTNKTDKCKTLVDFAQETPWIVEKFLKGYDPNEKEITQENLVKSAKINNIYFDPHEEKEVIFGDEDGTLVGRIYDYMLRGEDLSPLNEKYNEREKFSGVEGCSDS